MRRSATILLALPLLALAACGSDPTSAESVATADFWVKAVDSGMTAAFGTLTNDAAEDATLVSATTDAAGRVELHEVVMRDGEMVMQPKEGGITVPGDGSATLAPGGDHIMLMEVTGPIAPGDEVELTLTWSDDSTTEVTATAKEFTGANEDYRPS